jgi:RNA polymerase sigma factor (sigma-70 family)
MTPLLSNQLLRTQSDRRLAALAAAGHDRAFEAIVDRYRKPLQRYLRRLLSEALAEDVLQASFVRAWQALKSGSEVRDLRPWLYRIAHNQAVNALRAASAGLPEVSGVEAAASTETAVQQRDELRRTLDGIGALPERQRAALVAIAVADRPHADVARELGLSEGALRQLLLRARTALRAAATAVTPYPFVGWLSAGSDATASRMAEVAAGAGSAGVAFKAGAAVLAAGAVVAGAPALRDEHPPPRAAAKTTTAAVRATPVAERTRSALSPSAVGDDNRGRSGSSGHGSSGKGSGSGKSGHGGKNSGHGSGDDHSGSGKSGSGGGSGSDDSGSGHSGRSGSGSSGSDDASGSGSGHSGSRESERSGSSGHGAGSGGDDSGDSGSAESGSGSRDGNLGATQPEIQRSGSDDGSGSGGGDSGSGGGDGGDSSGSGHGGDDG